MCRIVSITYQLSIRVMNSKGKVATLFKEYYPYWYTYISQTISNTNCNTKLLISLFLHNCEDVNIILHTARSTFLRCFYKLFIKKDKHSHLACITSVLACQFDLFNSLTCSSNEKYCYSDIYAQSCHCSIQRFTLDKPKVCEIESENLRTCFNFESLMLHLLNKYFTLISLIRWTLLDKTRN